MRRFMATALVASLLLASIPAPVVWADTGVIAKADISSRTEADTLTEGVHSINDSVVVRLSKGAQVQIESRQHPVKLHLTNGKMHCKTDGHNVVVVRNGAAVEASAGEFSVDGSQGLTLKKFNGDAAAKPVSQVEARQSTSFFTSIPRLAADWADDALLALHAPQSQVENTVPVAKASEAAPEVKEFVLVEQAETPLGVTQVAQGETLKTTDGEIIEGDDGKRYKKGVRNDGTEYRYEVDEAGNPVHGGNVALYVAGGAVFVGIIAAVVTSDSDDSDGIILGSPASP